MSTKHKRKIMPLIFDTYLAVIRNSAGSKLFRNFYAKVDGKKADIMRNGELSCAFYVSSVLVLFKFIIGVHGTVDSTIKDLKDSGWKEIKKPKIGSVLIWEKMDFGNNSIHKHIGFFIGGNKAISNSYKLGYPVEHSWNFNAKRKVDMILWNHRIHLSVS
ncbi:MAG TPA: hypothetical protein VJL27_02955 [Patescibacteria group bacterium]|nr:hypothetical protein [Patescibacteria group bacterium]